MRIFLYARSACRASVAASRLVSGLNIVAFLCLLGEGVRQLPPRRQGWVVGGALAGNAAS